MGQKATATFTLTSWDEQPVDEFDGGRKLSRAKVGRTFTGDIEGDGAVEYTMAYAADGTARFVGYERITGSVLGRSGSVVLECVGTFTDGVAKGDLRVAEGLGTGDLADLTGTGSFEAETGPSGTLTLDVG